MWSLAYEPLNPCLSWLSWICLVPGCNVMACGWQVVRGGMCRKLARGSGKGVDEAGEALLEGGKRCVCVCVCVCCFPDGRQ